MSRKFTTSIFVNVIVAFAVLVITFIPFPKISTTSAQSEQVVIFGPLTIERGNGKPLSEIYRIVLPDTIIGPYVLQVVNGPDGSLQISSATVKINGVTYLKASDFKKKKNNFIEREVNLDPVNTLEIQVDFYSQPGSRLEITILGVDTTPEEVVLAEERALIGSGGGVLALTDVGEFELVEDFTRPDINIAVKKIQAPWVQDLFSSEILPDETISYLGTIFGVESDVLITTDNIIRVIVPVEFFETLQEEQIVGLFVLVDDGEGLSFAYLPTTYDPQTHLAIATLPAWAWMEKQVDETSLSRFPHVVAATTKYVSWVQLATANKSEDSIASGQFYSISGEGSELIVQGNERIQIEVRAEVIGRGTLEKPFVGDKVITSYFSGTHKAIDYDTADNDFILAAHDGYVSFEYSTTPYTCGYVNPDPGTDPNGRTLTGYGYSAKVVVYNARFSREVLYTTRYAHLIPGSSQVPAGQGNYVTRGTPIALAGHSGCSSGSHLHFEFWRGTLAKEDPRLYYPGGADQNVDDFKIGLVFNGKPLSNSIVAMDPGQLFYSLPLDLTSERLVAGGRYPLSLVLIDPSNVRHQVDWATVVVQSVPLRVTLRWDKYDTDVDTHVYDSLGNHSWYANLCGIPNGCLDRDDIDGYGPEVFTLLSAPRGVSYNVKIHYYSDHWNGPTTASIVVEVNGRVVTTRSVYIESYQWVDIGTYTPNP